MIPCEECLIYVVCKMREKSRPKFFLSDGKWGASVIELADREDCDPLRYYLGAADQDEVNEVRALFDMEPYK